MEITFFVFSLVGIALYTVTAIASAINMAASYARHEPRRIWLRELLWSLICMFQLLGLVLINQGSTDYTAWYINRMIWAAFSLVQVGIAWKPGVEFTSKLLEQKAGRERRPAG